MRSRTRSIRRHQPAVTYSETELARFQMADLLNDARSSLRFARELANGANPAHYGMTRDEFVAHATVCRAEYRALRAR